MLFRSVWVAPVFQQVTQHPGNLGNLVAARSAKSPEQPTYRQTFVALGSIVAVPPFWLRPGLEHPVFKPDGTGIPLATVLLCSLVLLSAYLALLVAARRRHDRTTTSLLLTGLVGLSAMFITIKNEPNPFKTGLLIAYLRAIWPTAAFVWLALLLAILRTFPEIARDTRRIVLTVAAVLVVAAFAIADIPISYVASSAPPWVSPMARQLQPQVRAGLVDHRPVLIGWDSYLMSRLYMSPVVLLELQDMGIPFTVSSPANIQQFGAARAFDPGRSDAAQSILVTSSADVPAGYHLIARARRGGTMPFDEFTALDKRVHSWATGIDHLTLNPAVPMPPAARATYQKLLDTTLAHATAHGRNAADDASFRRLALPVGSSNRVLFATPGIDQAAVARWASAIDGYRDNAVFVYLAPISVVTRPGPTASGASRDPASP